MVFGGGGGLKKIIPLEDAEQKVVAEYLDLRIGHYNWCHVPNGGNRNVITGKKLKSQGVKAGVPDILIFKRSKSIISKNFYGVAIEMKRKNMKPSDVKDEQKEWLKQLEGNRWLTHVAAGAGDAIEFLKKWGY